MAEIGVRELRQHASRVLARVRRGEIITVTDRGRPIARISPEPEAEWDAMVGSGAIREPVHQCPLHTLQPRQSNASASAVLSELREGEM